MANKRSTRGLVSIRKTKKPSIEPFSFSQESDDSESTCIVGAVVLGVLLAGLVIGIMYSTFSRRKWGFVNR